MKKIANKIKSYSKVKKIFIFLAAILVIRLVDLSVVQGDEWSKLSKNMAYKGIYTPAARGSIYDRNGVLLADNVQTFTVRLNLNTIDADDINDSIITTIRLLNENGDKVVNNFPMEYKDGEIRYKFQDEIDNWLRANKIDVGTSASQAFDILKERYEIDSNDKYEIQKILNEKYAKYPPINIRSMRYRQDIEKDQFLESYNLDKNESAKVAFEKIKEKYEVDKNLSAEEALAIVAIRYEIKQNGLKKYIPIEIANNVSKETILEIKGNQMKYPGMEVISDMKRYYPQGNLASHILGYMGKISEEKKSEYEKKGYDISSMIGQSGIEAQYESILRGHDGMEVVQVNTHGEAIKSVDKSVAKKGNDVYLTIDSRLQKTTEDSLEKLIKSISSRSKAASGAAVVIDVKTGEVLALANYPDFNPNLFVEGISSEDWASLQSYNPYDPLSPAPLFNLATNSMVQPGSTFKPITALAALDSGLNPDTAYKDDGHIKIGQQEFGCWLWNARKGNHGYIALNKAMSESCNCYFWNIATNKDWSNGQSLGLKDMGIDKILKFAKQLGLDEKTGIEIEESSYGLPSLDSKIQANKAQLKSALYAEAEKYFDSKVVDNAKRLEKDIDTIVKWTDMKGITYSKMTGELLPQVSVKPSKYREFVESFLYVYFNKNSWTTGDVFNLSIGQGSSMYTPIQMANYMATLGDEGRRHKVTVVKNVQNEYKDKSKQVDKLDTSSKVIDDVLESMNVTAKDNNAFRVSGLDLCMKTGTAQKFGKVKTMSEKEYLQQHLGSFGNMSWNEVKEEVKRLRKTNAEYYTNDDVAYRKAVINLSNGRETGASLNRFKGDYDDFAWMVALAPYKDPKIAIAVYVPQGKDGWTLAPLVVDIVNAYMNKDSKTYNDMKINKGLN
ncbi:MAG: penicillin-binding transpeptidase domain-containing protein [Eubacteriales bacterium]|nr:penicillin-binding transpeptidase domain-containing protein [Eubacteriales bacterium]MDY3332774.1 penicillin-binding transpeptidase domain-containing protein [Gallibacter sp.]